MVKMRVCSASIFSLVTDRNSSFSSTLPLPGGGTVLVNRPKCDRVQAKIKKSLSLISLLINISLMYICFLVNMIFKLQQSRIVIFIDREVIFQRSSSSLPGNKSVNI